MKKLNIDLEILTKNEKNISEDLKITTASDVIKIKEVQAIRNAVREHVLFIGLDRGNNVRNISVLGIGSNCGVIIDSKDIIRTALNSYSDKVILVHNHPSNNLAPSAADKHFTNVTDKILKVFNIELLDHIIVAEKDYISMMNLKHIDKNYKNNDLENMSKGLLIEEIERLKKQVEDLLKQKENDENLEQNQDDIEYDY